LPFVRLRGYDYATVGMSRLQTAQYGYRIVWKLIRDTFTAWHGDRAFTMAAALAFYSAFSLAPLAVILIAIVAAIFGEDAARGAIVGKLSDLVGQNAASAVQALLATAKRTGDGPLASIIGTITLLFGATSVFAELQSDLDHIWRAEHRASSGVWSAIRARLVSFAVMIVLGILLSASVVGHGLIVAYGEQWFGSTLYLEARFVNYMVSLTLLTLLFALLYKGFTVVRIAWSDVMVGAVVTAILMSIGHVGIAVYLGSATMLSTYRVAGTLIALLLWLYYSALVFLLGAEFCRVYAMRFGSLRTHNRSTAQVNHSAKK
jgi:membrane protein